MKLKTQEKWWIGIFITLWMVVSTISTIHSVEFFKLSNSAILSWGLAFAFELGAIASLGGLIISRGGKGLIWFLFILLTAFQIHCNMYWAWVNAGDLTEWVHLLNLIDEDPDVQKRIFSVVSGGILPVVALGFMKSLMDYLKPEKMAKRREEDEEVEEVEETEYHLEGPTGEMGPDDSGIGLATNEEYTEIEDVLPKINLGGEDEVYFATDGHPDPVGEKGVEGVHGYTPIEGSINVDEEKKKKPFWSSLDEEETLKVLDQSTSKIKRGVSKGNNEK